MKAQPVNSETEANPKACATGNSLNPKPMIGAATTAPSAAERRLMRLMDKIYLIDPCIGTRRLVDLLKRDHGERVNRKRLQRLR